MASPGTGARLDGALLAAFPLEESVPSPTYRSGLRIFEEGKVHILARSAAAAHLSVRNHQNKTYQVKIQAVNSGRSAYSRLMADCECPIFDEQYMPCPHIVAAVLELKSQENVLGAPPPPAWEKTLNSVLQDLGSRAEGKRSTATRSLLFFSLQDRTSGRWGLQLYSLPASRFPAEALGAGDVPLQPDLIAQTIKQEKLSGNATAVRTFDIARFPYATVAERQAGAGLAMLQQHSYYSYYAPDGLAEQTLSLLAGSGMVYRGTDGNPLRQRIDVFSEGAVEAALKVEYDDKGDGLRLVPSLLWKTTRRADPIAYDLKKDRLILNSPTHVLTAQGRIAPLTGVPAAFRSLVERPAERSGSRGKAAEAEADTAEILIPAESKERFYNDYLLPLASQLSVVGNAIEWERSEAEEAPPMLVPRVFLSENEGSLRAQLRFAYGETEVRYDPALPTQELTRGGAPNVLRSVRRDAEAEAARYTALGSGTYGLKREPADAGGDPGAFVLRARTDPVDFLLHHAPRLAADGFEIYGEEELKSVRVNRNRPTLSLGVTSGIDWFDVQAVLKFGDIEASLADVKKAVRRRERYVKLADGSIGAIPQEYIDRFRYLFSLGEDTETGLRLTATQALLLDQALADADGDSTIDAEFAARRERLRAAEAGIKPHPLPESGINATLYPYQKAGYDWLHFLHEYGFGGCLADEMGLGKTLTTLAFLLSLRSGDDPPKTPALVVVPRSLVFNWEREAARFTPDLRVRVYAGGKRARDVAAAIEDCDILLTTYGILLRDIDALRTVRFHYAILDEAQAVKNPMSQSARAARLISADHRLTLTGTPVENGTLELWSQFSFLNPGLLGNLERFKDEFAAAIERRQDDTAAQTLRRLTGPFLLRRTKDQVARELPPRTEHLVYSEMEPEQRKIYERLRDQYRAQVLGILDETGRSGAHMKILEGLLRLRQVCCHPALVDRDFAGDSAKMTLLLETLETLLAEGHKALVFSQFTQMLALIRKALDERGIPYMYLDGRTRDRQTPVDQFQNDPSVPFFLISLKAGGVGLNLTAADYVMHVDPWWNPAVERQATDRTHRIGQDKPVFVYKFVTRDSVEEKILTLQERKRNLVDQLISAEGGIYKSLTRADIEGLFS